MSKRLQELLTEIATKSNEVNSLFDAADKRGDGVNTKDEIDRIKAINTEIEDLDKEAAELKAMADIRRGNDDRRKAAMTPAPGTIPHQGANGGGQQQRAIKTVGDLVLSNPEMASFLKSFEGRAVSNRKIDSPPVELEDYIGLHRNGQWDTLKALITGDSATSAGALVFPDFKPIVDRSYERPLAIRDIITIGETNSDTVEYVRVTSVTNNAAPTAEAVGADDGTGEKPESEMALERVTETVKTIAHWIPATNRALSDAGQIRTLIDSFLRYGLEEELEDQILTGSGAGENFTGVLNTTGTTTQAWDTNILTTTRKARTKVRVTGRARPTAYVMHPNDWQTIDLLQDNEARYYFGGPMRIGNPMLWGLPVVECEGMTEGVSVVADWRLAVLWDRMQTMISMSNSHADFFIRNLVAILAELRAAFGVIRPAAFVEIDLTA